MAALLFAGLGIGAFIVTWLILPKIEGMLTDAGFVRPNYRKEEIPLGVGLVFFLAALAVIAIGRALFLLDSNAYIFLFAMGAMGLFGLIDDVFGTRGASGLKGHFKKLFIERDLTTGALKALAGGFIALMVSIGLVEGTGLHRWVMVLANTLIMALATNAINLLDLRPGRAGKSFLVLALLVVLAGVGKPQLMYLAVIMGSLIAFMPHDLGATAMMGDTGSNMLGMTLGFVAVHVMALPVKLVFLAFLVGFHLLTEKYSLTKIIEKNSFLNYLDMLGRRQQNSGERQ